VRSPLLLPCDPAVAADAGLAAEELVPVFALTAVARSLPAGARISHYRSHQGARADLVLELGARVLALQLRPGPVADRRALRGLRNALAALPGAEALALAPGEAARRLDGRLAIAPLELLASDRTDTAVGEAAPAERPWPSPRKATPGRTRRLRPAPAPGPGKPGHDLPDELL
jgi:hypothetical protein